ncbi:MAG: sialate O-acetylesterase [Bacteroidales bacterium]
MESKKSSIAIILLSLIFCISSYAQQLKLAELFNEGAVLQRNAEVSVWGTATSFGKVLVSIQGKSAENQADKNGNWSVSLPVLKAGGPYRMTVVSASETIQLNEIYVGEVWIAGGQSNMAFMLENSDNGKDEISKASNNNIRFVMVPYKAFEGDKNRGDMNWRTATTENIPKISAVAYYFAKDLQAKLNVPVGIICCYKGGSGAQSWTSRESILSKPELAPYVENYEKYISKLGKAEYLAMIDKYEVDLKRYNDSTKVVRPGSKKPSEPMGERNYNRPAGLYENMLKRIIPYTVQGTIWYQGEHNANRAKLYQSLFPVMIEQWREDFNNPAMPFLFVQLPSYEKADTGNRPIWPELREAQLMTWQKVENTGMAVTIDLGEKDNIHPTNKEPVGNRLSAIAFNKVYGIDVPYSGPLYKNVEFKTNKAILSFDFIYDGLKSDGDLKGFAICGADKIFVPAKAEIQGNQIIVWSESISSPVAVRYGWENWTEANLKNKAGFMASPFRTDDFKLLTAAAKAPSYKIPASR